MNFVLRRVEETLKHDLEYAVSITPKTPLQNLKRYIRFRIKKCLPKSVVHHLRLGLWYVTLYCRCFRPTHLLKMLIHWWNQEHYISIYGGFGDVLMMLPFFKEYSKRHPSRHLTVVYNDPQYNKHFKTAYWRPLYFFTKKGEKIVPIEHFLESLKYINRVIPGDIWDDGYDCWFAPFIAHRLKGRYYRPSEYQGVLQDVFSSRDMAFAEAFAKKHEFEKKFIVGVHFRTSVQCVQQLFDCIAHDPDIRSRVCFLLFGSSQHDSYHLESHGAPVIDLTDNYEKGMSMRELLSIGQMADLYIGGRGGFDLFFWISQVPTINIFDVQGRGELEKMWPECLWKENRFPELYWAESFDAERVFSEQVKPYFFEWLRKK